MNTATEAGSEQDEHRWSELMVNAQAGNEVDYRQLLTELSKAIHHYLISRIGRHHFIEDCVQDTLIAIHQARHTYDARRPFRPWLFAIVRHKAIDTLRRQQAYNRALERQITLSVEQQHSLPIDNNITQGRFINGLSPMLKEAITLTKIIGLTTHEAAIHLSISESALKVRVHRAIKKLKKLLEAEEI